jgi:hypothetical protein
VLIMTRHAYLLVLAASSVAAAACTDHTAPGGPPPVEVNCSTPTAVNLAPGEFTVVDPAASGPCVQLPAAGAGGAEHLYVALATAGQETTPGISTTYSLAAAAVGQAVTAAASVPSLAEAARAIPGAAAFETPGTAGEFHEMLRQRERELSTSPASRFFSGALAAPPAFAPPSLGSQRSFKVCSTTDCTAFVTVTATALHVGPKGAVYVDNTVPTGGYSQADIDSVGNLFDAYLYPIDTVAFGRESDLDNNGVVVVLLTDQVNKLSGSCNSAGSVILGYFYGADLIPSQNGSNAGEIFYGLVPDPGNSSCTISKAYAKTLLAPTFIHEFQHMISFNQHVLLRGGLSEDTWLNEGLSHLAEELGGRQIPNAVCSDDSGVHDCFSQFAKGDVQNGYRYLRDVESTALVEDSKSTGTLAERGANWLFVRWLADQFGSDSLGTNFTRAIDATSSLGSSNVTSVTGQPFATLVAQWQLANYLDNLAGFTASSPRLQYSSFDLRATYAKLNQQLPATFPRVYPLIPDSTLTGSYHRNGVLRDGSGRHLRVVQAASAPAVNLQLSDSVGSALGGSAVTRIGIVRIR